MNTKTPAIIFSVCRAVLNESQNKGATKYAIGLLKLKGIGYYVAVGAYKDEREDSFVVSDTGDHLRTVRCLAQAFGQESILRTDVNGQAWLENWQGEVLERLGKLIAVPELDAKKRDAWTFCNDRYWITV